MSGSECDPWTLSGGMGELWRKRAAGGRGGSKQAGRALPTTTQVAAQTDSRKIAARTHARTGCSQGTQATNLSARKKPAKQREEHTYHQSHLLAKMWKRGGRVVAFSLTALLLICPRISCKQDATPPVKVQLYAPWDSPPFLLEILEAAHTERPDAFFPLITSLLNPWALEKVLESPSNDSGLHFVQGNEHHPTRNLSVVSDEQIYLAAKNVLETHNLLPVSGTIQNWELALALHTESVKVSAFWQLYETSDRLQRKAAARNSTHCGSWVDFADRVLCTEEELLEALQDQHAWTYSVTPALTNMDHVFLGTSLRQRHQSPVAVLYADPYATNFWPLHHRLTEYALGSVNTETPLRYVLRWKPTAQKGASSLTGYGASLDLKKVDYLVIDDRKLADTAASKASSSESPGQEALSLQERDAAARRAWLHQQLNADKADADESLGSLKQEELTGECGLHCDRQGIDMQRRYWCKGCPRHCKESRTSSSIAAACTRFPCTRRVARSKHARTQ